MTASEWMAEYWPGWYCSVHRCGYYRAQDEDGHAYCWLRFGIGAEDRENECLAYQRQVTQGKGNKP